MNDQIGDQAGSVIDQICDQAGSVIDQICDQALSMIGLCRWCGEKLARRRT
ncbi:hypothetical protein [Streptomyces sp. MB09-02B]|uniref:hypothetical protein n=1 Tax=Streptomyces sp. MB09-02B TaxID=3028667 RepID=UPI0029BB8E49|nr:hypothetical protein [Streptomyces sp. MB09-02B]MDX3645094.1 hypothetical protein [Streptomyces sp. MB09-02B]